MTRFGFYAIVVIVYISIGFLIGLIACRLVKDDIPESKRSRCLPIIALEWPLVLATFLMYILFRLLLWMVTKPLIWLLWAILMIYLLLSIPIEVKAAEIVGEKPLGGLSVLFAQKTECWYSDEDLNILANVLEHENYCNGERAMYLTGAVVINRRNSPKWPNTIHDVVYQKGQYSTVKKFNTRTIHDECIRIASWLLIFGCPDVPPGVVFQAMFKQGSGVYEKVKTDYFCYGPY